MSEPAPCDMNYLQLRCRPCGECLEWLGAHVHGRFAVVTLRIPAPDGSRGQRQFYVRHLMYWLRHGRRPPVDRQRVLTVNCGNERCVAPAHLVLTTKTKVNQRTAATGAWRTLAFRAKVAIGRRRNSELSDAAVAEIQNTDTPIAELAQRNGITETYARFIRKGKNRVDYSNPLAALHFGGKG